MKKEDFWNLIDETNQLCPTHDQESIMAVATDKLLKLSVKDICTSRIGQTARDAAGRPSEQLLWSWGFPALRSSGR